MKCQILFSGKNKKNISKCHLSKVLCINLNNTIRLKLSSYLSHKNDSNFFLIHSSRLEYLDKYFSYFSMKIYVVGKY